MERVAYYDQGVYEPGTLVDWAIPQKATILVDKSTRVTKLNLHPHGHASQIALHGLGFPVEQLIDQVKLCTGQRILFSITGVQLCVNQPDSEPLYILKDQSILCKASTHLCIQWSPAVEEALAFKQQHDLAMIARRLQGKLSPMSLDWVQKHYKCQLQIEVVYNTIVPCIPVLRCVSNMVMQYRLEIPAGEDKGVLYNRIKGEPAGGNEMISLRILLFDKHHAVQAASRIELVGSTDLVFLPQHMMGRSPGYSISLTRQRRLNFWEAVEYFDLVVHVNRVRFTGPLTCYVLANV